MVEQVARTVATRTRTTRATATTTTATTTPATHYTQLVFQRNHWRLRIENCLVGSGPGCRSPDRYVSWRAVHYLHGCEGTLRKRPVIVVVLSAAGATLSSRLQHGRRGSYRCGECPADQHDAQGPESDIQSHCSGGRIGIVSRPHGELYPGAPEPRSQFDPGGGIPDTVGLSPVNASDVPECHGQWHCFSRQQEERLHLLGHIGPELIGRIASCRKCLDRLLCVGHCPCPAKSMSLVPFGSIRQPYHNAWRTSPEGIPSFQSTMAMLREKTIPTICFVLSPSEISLCCVCF
mmetsp:Transcript_24935/g.58084  ORF Transcript_24935/g.58084 Transcript_24935/m.58084 type:complete len:291 (+) Transcript_24935:190-1062(+)